MSGSCTVRGDLVRILNKLLKRKDRFDAILIETTGLADPAPVAQTFFVDDSLAGRLTLDAIITVVDAKHVEQHLDDEKPEGVENEVPDFLSCGNFCKKRGCNLVSVVGMFGKQQCSTAKVRQKTCPPGYH